MPVSSEQILLVAAVAVLAFLLRGVLFRPLSLLIWAAWRFALGGLVVWAMGYVAVQYGFAWAFNVGTAAIVGFLGIPGLALLTALSLWVYS